MKSGKLVRTPKQTRDPEAPIPFDELAAGDKFWCDDPGDEVLPKDKGFITDCVFRHRGKEVTTLFTIWSTLFVLSSAVKREAWVRFGPKKLWSNFYCVLVGPAGIAHKTEAINDATTLLTTFQKLIEDPNMRLIKYINVVADKATPEGLIDALNPKYKEPRGSKGFFFRDKNNEPIINPKTGRKLWYSKTAEAAIIAHEFATFAGMQKYNVGLSDNLLAFYDCDQPFTYRKAKEVMILKNLHTTMLAGTTLQGFRASIGEGMRSDGFLSRTVLVYCPTRCGRRFSRPRIVDGSPDNDELAKRLAWIAQVTVGEYDLSPEADKFYDKWYNKWADELEEDTQYQGMKSRFTVLVLKIAFLLRIQRYDSRDKIISLQDVKSALMLIKKTWFESLPMVRGFEQDVKPFIGRLEEYVRSHPDITRMTLLRQGKFTAAELREGLTLLSEEGKIEIYLSQTLRTYPSSNTKEIYKWCGERWLGAKAEGEI